MANVYFDILLQDYLKAVAVPLEQGVSSISL